MVSFYFFFFIKSDFEQKNVNIYILIVIEELCFKEYSPFLSNSEIYLMMKSGTNFQSS